MISAIVFDYDGVIEISERNIFQEICDYLKITREELSHVWHKFNYLCNVYNTPFPEVMFRALEEFNISDVQKSNIGKMISVFERTLNAELIEMIKELKAKNFKIGLMSNYGKSLRQRLTEKELIDLFDVVIISGEVGFQKPQPEIFQILFDKLGVTSNEVVFIDDTPRSLEGAERIGYTPILFKDNNQLREELDLLI